MSDEIHRAVQEAVRIERSRIMGGLTRVRHDLLGRARAVEELRGTGARLAYEDAATRITEFMLANLGGGGEEEHAED